jgi:hypothetical protein
LYPVTIEAENKSEADAAADLVHTTSLVSSLRERIIGLLMILAPPAERH